MSQSRGRAPRQKRQTGAGRRRSSSPGVAAAVDPAPDLALDRTPDPVTACTPLQEAFCIEFLVDRSIHRAYQRARGKSVAKQTAYELYCRPQVQARIAELSAAHLGDATRRKNVRIGALLRTALDPGEKTSDRLRAIELSGKIDGDFVEKHEHAGKLTLEQLLAASHEAPAGPST